MSNVKISALPAVTTVVPGSDVLPLVSGGITTKSTANQLVQAVLPAPGNIGAVTPAAGTFTTLASTSNAVALTSAGSGVATLQSASTASNVTVTIPGATDTLVNLNSTQTLTNKTLTSAAISGGTIDNSVIGGTTAAAGTFTNLAYTGTLTGGTGVIAIGTNQIYKDSSGNVGIGTSSPSWKLTVSDGTTTGGMVPNGGNLYLGTISNNPILFRTNNTDKMTLDSSGNLGLGVTPKSWDFGKAIEIGASGNSLWGAAASNFIIAANAYYSSSALKYANTAAATYYQQVSGAHQWFTAPSGTAGSAISFTQAMTLDASGNLGVGTSSPTAFGGGYIVTQTTGSSGGYSLQTSGTVISQIAADSGYGASLIGTRSNHPVYFVINNTERARIDSSGNFKIANLTTNGAVYSNGTALTNTNPSDHRLKENIIPVPYGLAEINKLNPVSFNWKNDPKEKKSLSWGFIAQEVQPIMPELVTTFIGQDEEEYFGLETNGVYTTLVRAIQELSAELNELKAKVNA